VEAVGRGQPLPLPNGRVEEANLPVESHTSTYFRWREAKERELAERASAPDIRDIYLSLADWYRCLAENAEAMEHKESRRGSHLHSEPTPWD
jgi:hypothetical protein